VVLGSAACRALGHKTSILWKEMVDLSKETCQGKKCKIARANAHVT
jgi:hypothetical protein